MTTNQPSLQPFEPGTPVMFAGLHATVVSFDPKSPSNPYAKVRLQYQATGNRETVAADAVRPDLEPEPCGCWSFTHLGRCLHTV